MVLKKEYLVLLNSRNRVQQALLQLNQNPFSKEYTIERTNCQWGGKEIQQPTITVSFGRAGRTIAEQAVLQYNALLKNYLDKGYVKASVLSTKDYNSLSEQEIIDALGGGFVSDQQGVPKPMLAKSADKCAASIWNKEMLASKKLDGTRMLLYCKNGIIQTASRGGGNYNAAAKHIRENSIIKELFKQNPDLILDGELYKHGSEWPLQRISGLARLKEWTEECGELEFWIYDYISEQPFKERLEVLNELRTLFPDDSSIKICEHVSVSSYMEAKQLHDQWVKEGFEGLCARNPEREYGINKRSALYLVKLKMFTDDEFLITGVKEGLREEDMCFTLQTKNGKEFSAKPTGTAEQRRYYLEHPEEYVGKMGTCKFFYYSKDGIPQLPVFKCVREKGE
jgi:DNA ligase-1